MFFYLLTPSTRVTGIGSLRFTIRFTIWFAIQYMIRFTIRFMIRFTIRFPIRFTIVFTINFFTIYTAWESLSINLCPSTERYRQAIKQLFSQLLLLTSNQVFIQYTNTSAQSLQDLSHILTLSWNIGLWPCDVILQDSRQINRWIPKIFKARTVVPWPSELVFYKCTG